MSHIPKQFNRANLISLLKPGKEGIDSADFRPVFLFSVI